jgi:hypothetical protein
MGQGSYVDIERAFSKPLTSQHCILWSYAGTTELATSPTALDLPRTVQRVLRHESR